VGNKYVFTSVTFMLGDRKIFSDFIVILYGQKSSRRGCYDDDDDDDDANYLW